MKKMQPKESLHKMFRTDVGKCQLIVKIGRRKYPLSEADKCIACTHIFMHKCVHIYTYTYKITWKSHLLS